MPRQKDLKRLVRSRMQKTGESYTAARTQITRKSATPKRIPAFATLAGMSDSAIRAKTGRTWAEWVDVLDAVGASSLPHRKIAEYVHHEHGVDGWWSQSVTVGYERIKGLREKGQRRDGRYEASKSRTFDVPVATLFKAFTNARSLAKWMPETKVTIRKATPERSVRLGMPDGSIVAVWLVDKSTTKTAKSQAGIQHTKLASKADAAKWKAWWSERLDHLSEIL